MTGMGLFARKVCMTHMFDEAGVFQPVTVLKTEICIISQVKTVTTDGYNAIQVAYQPLALRKVNKPTRHHVLPGLLASLYTIPTAQRRDMMYRYATCAKVGRPQVSRTSYEDYAIRKTFSKFGEFRVDTTRHFEIGQNIRNDIFSIGQNIKVTGKSIGKGFSGNQKRHNFSRGPMTHGSKNHRLPGSIGAGTTPGRVYPGKKMAGQLGYKNVTLNTKILYLTHPIEYDDPMGYIIVKGSVPGKPNNILKLQPIL